MIFTNLNQESKLMTSLKLPALSPATKITQDFSTSNIEITYSRPSARGRHIFGGIVPFGKIWRTGANTVTRIKTHEDLEIAGNLIKAGEYALYTIPGEDSWEVILNTGTSNWGVGGYNTDGDVARFHVTPVKPAHTYNTFTIDITGITFNICNIELIWEDVKIVIPVTADNEVAINENVDLVMEDPAAPYYLIATYYHEKHDRLDVAKKAIDKALEQQPKAYYMWHLKAKVEKALGRTEDAVTAANTSKELAVGTPYEYTFSHLNELLLADMN